MLVMYGVVACSLWGANGFQWLIMMAIGGIIHIYQGFRSTLVWIVLCVVLLLSFYLDLSHVPFVGRVSAVADTYLMVTDGIYKYYVFDQTGYELDDIVWVEGTVVSESSPYYHVQRIKGRLTDSSMRLVQRKDSWRKALWEYYADQPLIQAILFNINTQEYGFMASMAIQLAGTLYCVQRILRFFLPGRQVDALLFFLLMGYACIFGFSFGVIRLLLNRYSRLLKGDRLAFQVVGLVLCFPLCTHYLGFMYVYGPALFKGLSVRFKNIKRIFILALVMLKGVHRIHMVELVSYRLLSIIASIVWLLAWLAVGIPGLKQVIVSFSSWVEGIRLTSWYHRLTLVGDPGWLWLLLIVVLLYTTRKKGAMVVYGLVLV